MGFLDFIKKNKKNDQDILNGNKLIKYIHTNLANPTDENVLKVLKKVAEPDDDLNHLTAEGELPFGWLTHNKPFTENINGEYSHFLNMWLDARQKSPKELYPVLKSFVLYLEDAEKLCKSKGECFEFWFYEIIASKAYIQERKNELDKIKKQQGDAYK